MLDHTRSDCKYLKSNHFDAFDVTAESTAESTECRSDYRGIDSIVTQIGGNEQRVKRLNRTASKVFELLLNNSARQYITVFLWRWIIDRITSYPYSRWRSRIVDRLLTAIEGGGDRG